MVAVAAVEGGVGFLDTLTGWWRSFSFAGDESNTCNSINSVSNTVGGYSNRNNGKIEEVLRLSYGNDGNTFLAKEENDATRLLSKIDLTMHSALSHESEDLVHVAVSATVDNSEGLNKIVRKDNQLVNSPHGKQLLTPLHRAAFLGSDWAIPVLLQAGASMDVVDKDGNTPLMLASSSLKKGISGKKVLDAMFKHISAAKKIVNKENHKGLTPVCMASMTGDAPSLKVLLANGGNPHHREPRMSVFNTASGDGFSPLCYAVQSGSIKCVKLLLNQSVNVNHAGKNMVTPLHIAASNGNADCVRALIKAGAKINEQTSTGSTPLSLACAYGNVECARVLLSDTSPQHILPALYEALKKGKSGCAYLIVYRNLHASLDFGPALFLAIESNISDKDVLEILSQTDAVHARMKNGDSPLKLAAKKGNGIAVSVLLDGHTWSEKDIKESISVANGEVKNLLVPTDNRVISEECVCCLLAPSNVVFLPCNHIQCCAKCSESVMRVDPRCPMCREPISKTMPT